MNKIFFIGLVVPLLFFNCGGSDENYVDPDTSNSIEKPTNPTPEYPDTPTSYIPELLYGKWQGEDSRGQTLILIINKDGSCCYQREDYVNEEGVFSYIPDEKKLVTTMEENGSGPIIYIIEMITETDLVVQTTGGKYYNYKRFYTYDIGDVIVLNGTHGIVIEINETGRSGIALSLTESEPIAWCSEEKYYDFIRTYPSTDISLSFVKNQDPDWYNQYPAYAWISELGEGWDMPTTKIISKIIGNKTVINEALIKNGGMSISSLWSNHLLYQTAGGFVACYREKSIDIEFVYPHYNTCSVRGVYQFSN